MVKDIYWVSINIQKGATCKTSLICIPWGFYIIFAEILYVYVNGHASWKFIDAKDPFKNVSHTTYFCVCFPTIAP